MRDPERIDKTLAVVRKIWKQNPDLRLLQLLLNVVGDSRAYYVEDNTLVNYLKTVYEKTRE